jgi:hypothetical protein
MIEIQAPRLPADLSASPRQLIEQHFPSVGTIPISGGWGYGKDDCVVINKDDPTVSKVMPFDGVSVEYVFAEKRIYEELIIFQGEGNKYSGIEWNLIKQSLKGAADRHFDYLTFNVTALPDRDWEHLKNDWMANDGFSDSETGLERHLEEREGLTCCYTAEYWFEITSYFGKF